MRHRELLPGIHLFTSSAWQMTSLVAFLGEEALVVDPGYFPEEIEAQVALLSGRPQARPTLLVTHGDFDHVTGRSALPSEAPVIGHHKLRRRREEKIAEQVAAIDQPLYVERPGPFVFPYPTVPVGEPLIRELGDERLHLFPAPGHASDSLFTLLERRGLFLAGDYLSELEFPFVYDSVPRYLATLNLAASLLVDFRPRVLVPGHGPVASGLPAMQERVARDRDYLERLTAGVEDAVHAGCGLRETQRRLSDLEYRGKPSAPHLTNEHRANVALLHRRRWHRPSPSPVG